MVLDKVLRDYTFWELFTLKGWVKVRTTRGSAAILPVKVTEFEKNLFNEVVGLGRSLIGGETACEYIVKGFLKEFTEGEKFIIDVSYTVEVNGVPNVISEVLDVVIWIESDFVNVLKKLGHVEEVKKNVLKKGVKATAEIEYRFKVDIPDDVRICALFNLYKLINIDGARFNKWLYTPDWHGYNAIFGKYYVPVCPSWRVCGWLSWDRWDEEIEPLELSRKCLTGVIFTCFVSDVYIVRQDGFTKLIESNYEFPFYMNVHRCVTLPPDLSEGNYKIVFVVKGCKYVDPRSEEVKYVDVLSEEFKNFLVDLYTKYWPISRERAIAWAEATIEKIRDWRSAEGRGRCYETDYFHVIAIPSGEIDYTKVIFLGEEVERVPCDAWFILEVGLTNLQVGTKYRLEIGPCEALVEGGAPVPLPHIITSSGSTDVKHEIEFEATSPEARIRVGVIQVDCVFAQARHRRWLGLKIPIKLFVMVEKIGQYVKIDEKVVTVPAEVKPPGLSNGTHVLYVVTPEKLRTSYVFGQVEEIEFVGTVDAWYNRRLTEAKYEIEIYENDVVFAKDIVEVGKEDWKREETGVEKAVKKVSKDGREYVIELLRYGEATRLHIWYKFVKHVLTGGEYEAKYYSIVREVKAE